MELKEAKKEFIEAWGTLGSAWGINRTMSQIHALLLISGGPLDAGQIMEELGISRGNANMNLRSLIDWGLVYKKLKPGERKDFFVADKDLWSIAKKIINERRKREITPVLEVLQGLSKENGFAKGRESKEFVESIRDMKDFVAKMDGVLEKAATSNEKWMVNTILRILK